MSFILANNKKCSFEKLEVWMLANSKTTIWRKTILRVELNTNSQENSWDYINVEQAICTKAVRHKSNKQEFNSVKKEIISSHAQGNWAKIMDRADVLIEKVTEQFLVEGSEIENRDGPYTADYYILTPKNIPADLLHSFE